MAKRIKWTDEMDNFLKNYPDTSLKELSEALEIGESSISRRRKKLGIKSSIEKIKSNLSEDEGLCVNCGEILPIDRFNVHKGTKNGRYSWCKECTSKAKRVAVRKMANQKNEALLKIEQFKKMTFKCSICKNLLLGEDFYFNKSNGARDCRCKKCKTKKDAENEIRRIKEGKGWA